MAEESSGAAPRSFLIISIVALLWNLFGAVSYIMQITMSAETLANMPEAERVLNESIPSWVTGVFAIAVSGGVIGCVGLLLKKTWCIPVFLVSLAAVVLQFAYWLLLTDAIDVYGPEAVAMPLFVTVIAVFLPWYSRGAKSKGWLT